ncbi:uncharacterized protein LOC129586579 [Paramacrobiotus metropolitanus]|uniref:uncharacterized protein LOC129586579 n=1 Tax=Paramacrobiotus metropolitanus TaxID=2943436 RepID=UPI0024463DDA|nr:uncharacterized protein LOC129586579 [Paramacrobiotus metropolitanus]
MQSHAIMANHEFNANCTRCQHNKMPCYMHLLKDISDPQERIALLYAATTAGNVSAYMEITRPEYWESPFNSPVYQRIIQRKRSIFKNGRREGWENPLPLPATSDHLDHTTGIPVLTDSVFGINPSEFAASMFRHAVQQKEEMKEEIENLQIKNQPATSKGDEYDVVNLKEDAEMDNGAPTGEQETELNLLKRTVAELGVEKERIKEGLSGQLQIRMAELNMYKEREYTMDLKRNLQRAESEHRAAVEKLEVKCRQ